MTIEKDVEGVIMKVLSRFSGLALRRAGESPEIKKHPLVYGCEMSVGKTPIFK
jgi:hypothetical protein